jgi:predicted ribosome quality control (RQC) complex YloA/Tae2 family protein
MVKIEIDTRLSAFENANKYYNASKKAKNKIAGAKKAIEKAKVELNELLSKKEEHLKKIEAEQAKQKEKKEIKKEWYEKFRWFFTSAGHLVVGGRDATSNEIIIKKHTDENDLVFHTDMAGSPFFILKLNDEKPTDSEIHEVGIATATFSRGFKLGLATNPVLYVNPSQVSKEANSGEYVAKGAFVIRGKTNYVPDVHMEIALGIVEGKLIAAPFDSLFDKTDKPENIVIVIQGDKKPSDAAKIIVSKLGYNDLDDIISKLPSGTVSILDDRKIKEKLLNKKYSK